MNSQEISQYLNISAHKYYEYVRKRNKSITTNRILSAKKHSDYFILRTEKKFRNGFETGQIQTLSKTFPDDSFTMVYVDNQKKRCAIATKNEELIDALRSAGENNVQFVTDLSFLIKRVENWSTYDNNIRLPVQPDVISIDSLNIKNGAVAQLNAVKGVLTKPVSYVWGAPGTGKTRFVLANSVLEYIKKNKRITVVAPTNNALDQTLRGVIETLKCEGIDYEKCVWRSGPASLQFCKEYPTICENTYLSSASKKIQQDIEYARQIQTCETQLKIHETFLDAFSQFKNDINSIFGTQGRPLLSNLETIYYDLEREVNACERKCSVAERDVETINKLIAYYTKKLFVFKRSKKIQEQTSAWEEKQRILNEELENLKKAKKHLQVYEACLASVCEKLNISRTVFEIDIKKIKSTIEKSQQERDELSNKIDDLRKILDSDLPTEEIIKKCEEQRKELGFDTKEVRLQKTLVLGLTIDKFIAEHNKINWGGDDGFIHIFLDEAGVCPLAKAIPLFSTGVPVSMFGDHMQLPPVCEMEDDEISLEKNREVFLWAMSAMFAPMVIESDIETLYSAWERRSSDFGSMPRYDLTDSFRFGPELAELLAGKVYSSEFRGNSQKSTKIVVIDAGKKPKGCKKRTNPAEVTAIKSYIQEMDIRDDYMIITPYKNQVELMKENLKSICDEDSISTVHASQGKECRKVFFSVVDCSNMFFTDSNSQYGLKIINTALSRAKGELIVVCDHEFWSTNTLSEKQLIRDIIKKARIWRPVNYFDF